MPDDRSSDNRPGKEGLAVLGIGALAIGCCAGLPLLVAFAGSVAVGTLLGVGAGILGAVALVAVVVLRNRARRRACEPRPPRRAPLLDRRD